MILLAVAACSNGSSGVPQPSGSNGTQGARASGQWASTPAPTQAPLGPTSKDPAPIVRGDGVTIAVLGWGPVTSSKGTFDPGSKAILVDVILAATSSTGGGTWTLVDTAGSKYTVARNYYYDQGAPDPFGDRAGPLVAGERTRGRLPFIVPTTSSGYSLSYEWFVGGEGARHLDAPLTPQPLFRAIPAELSDDPGTLPVGTVISAGDVRLAVLGWRSEPVPAAKTKQDGLPDNFRLVAIDIVAANLGARTTLEPYGIDVGLKDITGQRYDVWYGYATGTIHTITHLSPGERQRVTIWFLVPNNVNDLVVNVTESAQSPQILSDSKRAFGALGPPRDSVAAPASFTGEAAPQAQPMTAKLVVGSSGPHGSEGKTAEYQIRGVLHPAPDAYHAAPAAGMSILAVDVTIRNTGTSYINVGSSHWLKDDQDRYYRALDVETATEGLFPADRSNPSEVKAGETAERHIWFYAPSDAKRLQLVIFDQYGGTIRTFVNLDL